ncbi:MAG TPA: acyltransferase [Acidimicrobiia bacterium]
MSGLRAMAACSVIVFHVASYTTRFRGSSGPYLQMLDMGVWVFFVMSGFLLYRPFVRAHLTASPGPHLRAYAMRRVARVYPAYWVVLAFFTFVIPLASIRGGRAGLLHVLLLHTYEPHQLFAGIAVSWSLVAEMSFYVFLPCFALAVAALGRGIGPIAAEVTGLVVVFAVGFGAQLWDICGAPPAPVDAFPIHLYVFGLGMTLAVATARRWRLAVPETLRRVGDRTWPSWTVAAVLLAVVYCRPGGATAPPSNHAVAFLLFVSRALAAFFIVVPAVVGAHGRGAIRRALQCGPIVSLGTISYGLYLWHPLLIQAIQKDWLGKRAGTGNPVVLLVVAAPVVLVAATASWFLVERPVLQLARRAQLRPRAVLGVRLSHA